MYEPTKNLIDELSYLPEAYHHDWNRASVKMAVRDIISRDKIKNIDNCWWEQK